MAGKKKVRWKKVDEQSSQLRCTNCNNALFLISWEPVARQAKVPSAHHSRVVAVCPICKKKRRIGLGAPD